MSHWSPRCRGSWGNLRCSARCVASGGVPEPGTTATRCGARFRQTDALRHLLREVSTALLVSAAAITSPMVVTLAERLLISSLYRRTEEIAHDIDARFNAGAGEETRPRKTLGYRTPAEILAETVASTA